MKKIILILTSVSIFGFSAISQAAIKISTLIDVPPTNIAIQQLNSDGTNRFYVQNKLPESNSWKAITQVVMWRSNKKLSGIGLKFASDQPDWGSNSQQYVLVVQELTDPKVPIATLGQFEFVLTGDKVGPGKWLYMDFDDLQLNYHTWYGFTLCPVSNSPDATLSTHWATAEDADYFYGKANLIDVLSAGGLPITNAYGTTTNEYGIVGTDLTFFMIDNSLQKILISNPEDIPPTNVVIRQVNSARSGGIQSRNRTPDSNDWRAISQTFLWTSTNKLDGIGLYFNNEQFSWGNNNNQRQILVIQALDESDTPTSVVAQLEFQMTTDKVMAEQWLYMDFIDNIKLNTNQWYGFTLCPTSDSIEPNLRNYWAAADSGSYYPGKGGQINPKTSNMPRTDAYGSAGTDFTFFMTDDGITENAIILSNLTNLPAEHVAISQTNAGFSTSVQARNRIAGGNDWRAVTQTFQWNKNGKLDGIGLHFSKDQTNAWTTDQQYLLVIQALTNNIPTGTVAEIEFSMRRTNVVANQWLYMDIEKNIQLENGCWYGFSLCPPIDAVNPNQRTFWTAADSGDYYPGIGRQDNPQTSGMPKTNSYSFGGGINDLTFYMIDDTQDDIILSNPADIPVDNVAVEQPNHAGTIEIQARNRASNSSDWRAVSQTFQWTCTNALDGIGLYFGPSQDAWTSDQNYLLVIQAISNNLPISTVAELYFTMQPSKVGNNQWLYMDIINDVQLEENQWYGFTIGPPANAVSAQRTYWATSDTNDYPGRGAQFNPQDSGMPKTDVYGSANTDMTMFMIAAGEIPEPAIFALIYFVLFGWLLRKR